MFEPQVRQGKMAKEEIIKIAKIGDFRSIYKTLLARAFAPVDEKATAVAEAEKRSLHSIKRRSVFV